MHISMHSYGNLLGKIFRGVKIGNSCSLAFPREFTPNLLGKTNFDGDSLILPLKTPSVGQTNLCTRKYQVTKLITLITYNFPTEFYNNLNFPRYSIVMSQTCFFLP